MSSNTRQRRRGIDNMSQDDDNGRSDMNTSNPQSSISDSTADEHEEKSQLAQVLIRMVEGQQQNSNDMKRILQQLTEYQQQQIRLQEEQNRQHQETSSRTLARTSAGSPPIFMGKSNSIEVHRWIIAMDRWFETAKIEEDKEKITTAASALREAAQAWWAVETQAGRTTAPNTWKLFAEAIKKQFLPMDVDRWARMELKALVTQGNNQNILEYTSKFNELEQLIGNRNELDKILEYEEGLPDDYKLRSVEKRHSTLTSAIESTIALYKARLSTKAPVKIASINQMGAEGVEIGNSDTSVASSEGPSSSVSSPSPGGLNQPYDSIITQPQYITSLQEQVAQLTRIITQQSNRGGYYQQNRGGYRNWRGRPRGGIRYNRNARSRSPGLPLTSMGITAELIEARRSANQCLKCGEDNHYVGSCRNPPKTTN